MAPFLSHYPSWPEASSHSWASRGRQGQIHSISEFLLNLGGWLEEIVSLTFWSLQTEHGYTLVDK